MKANVVVHVQADFARKSLAVMHDKNYQKIRILVFYLLAGVLIKWLVF